MLRVAAAGLFEAWKGGKGDDKVAMGDQVSNERTPTLKYVLYGAVTDLTKPLAFGVSEMVYLPPPLTRPED